jgi:hypothetical protein
MPEETRLEKIADDFIETYLRDHPVMIYTLDTELKEYIQNIEELKNIISVNEILREYSKSEKKKTIDEEIINELIDAGDKTHDIAQKLRNASYTLSDDYNDEEYPDTSLLEYMQSVADPLICELMQLVVRSHKIRIRTMHELEVIGQEDPWMPNKWIYHKDLSLEKVLKHIVDFNDMFRKEDEMDF